MRFPLTVLFLINSIAQSTQVRLSQGEIGRLGTNKIEVIEVQDRRCGIGEDCPADVTALIRVWKNDLASLLILHFPPTPSPEWIGVKISNVILGINPRITFTNQSVANKNTPRKITLKLGETGQIGLQKVKLISLETRRCLPSALCARPVIHDIQIQIDSGKDSSRIYLEYPNPPAWAGLSIINVNHDAQPKLTFSNEQPR